MTDEADDKALMVRFQEEGDLRAFETLFLRNKDALYRFVLRLSGSTHVAEDVSQQAWLRIVEMAQSQGFDINTGATFQTFLFTLARNRFIDEHVRRHEAARTESLSEHDTDDLGPASDEDQLAAILDRAQARTQLHAALFALPFEQREVLALWLQGFELQEVAKMTQAPWHTVVSRKKYALRKLATILGTDSTTMASRVPT